MNREEIRDAFRAENPEITARVIPDTTLNLWSVVGNVEVCTKVRLVKDETAFNSVVGEDTYNLAAEITNFYDIDDMPGGGVYYDGEPLDLTSKSEQNERDDTWKSNPNGEPEYYWRRNDFLHFERPSDLIKEIIVDCVLYPDEFDADIKTPFNEQVSLRPFHYAMVLYLTKRAKKKVGKPGEAQIAKDEYNEYIKWMKKEIDRGTLRSTQLKPKRYYG